MGKERGSRVPGRDNQGRKQEVEGKREMGLEELAFLMARGGWPGSLDLSPVAALDTAIDYYEGVVKADMQRVDGVRRSPDRVRALLRAYARSVGTQATLARIAAEVNGGEPHTLTRATVVDYVDALRKNALDFVNKTG